MNSDCADLSICRICLCQDGVLKSVFAQENFSERTLAVDEVMTTCASIQVEADDGLPQAICTECLRRLSEAYAFKNLCEQTDFTLRNNLVLVIKLDDENMPGKQVPEERSAKKKHECVVCKKFFRDTHNLKRHMKSLAHLEQTNKADANGIQNIVDENLEVVEDEENVDEDLEQINIGETNVTENIAKEEIRREDDFDDLEHENSNATQISSQSKGKHKCLPIKSHKKLHINLKPYECDICNRRFTIKKYYENHKKTHSDVMPYICDICGKGCKYFSSLYKHKKTFHGPEKLRECPICKNYFSNKALELHLTTHSEADKSHQCDHCGKCFYNRSKLRRHIKTHVGYSCSICRTYFNDKTTMELHKSTHAKREKKYKCGDCGMCFYRNSNLTRHAKMHTGQEKQHECLICHKHFRDLYNLRQHMKIHTGEKNFECDVCGKFFSANTILMRHKKRHAS